MLTRNKTLWVAFALESPQRRLFFSGDSGYGPHFREIGERFGGFDLVALDMGQYDKRWANIHMTPEEAALAADELRTRTLVPAHVGRFSIARHAWDEPFDRITTASEGKSYRLSTPRIGEPLDLRGEGQQFSRWWVGADPIASSVNLDRTP
jgi:L-ascorbate metabolism protein UlaG (beta-lactamase superfamily)